MRGLWSTKGQSKNKHSGEKTTKPSWTTGLKVMLGIIAYVSYVAPAAAVNIETSPTATPKAEKPLRVAMNGFFDPFNAIKNKRSKYKKYYKKSKKSKKPLYNLGGKLPKKGHLKSYNYNNSLDFYDPEIGKYISPQKNLRYQRYAPNTYRTLCVRLQDGYYWPINFAQTRSKLYKDKHKCEQSCSAKVRLFIVPSTESDMSKMRDLKGRRYTSLKTAFLYRTKYIKEAKCKAAPWSQEAKAKHAKYAAVDANKKRRLHVRATHRAERKRIAGLKRAARKYTRTYRKRRYSRHRVAKLYRRKKHH